MVLLRAVPIVSLVTALAGSAVAAVPSPVVEVMPVLTSAPFGAGPGQPVTHTVTLSGTGVVTGVRVTFTTTVGLDGVTAGANPGRCPVVTASTVVCEFGDLDFAAVTAVPTMTITGVVAPGTAPGTLVRNLVSVVSAGGDASPAGDVVSNAYLVAAPGAAQVPAPTGTASPRRRPGSPVPAVAALLAFGALGMAGLILRRRRRRS